MGGKLTKIEIHDLREDTFYALLSVETERGLLQIDSRPSDAIALAVRFNAPIFVAREIYEHAAIPFQKESPDEMIAYGDTSEPTSREQKIEALQNQMDKAILEERYEDAARLRDEIKELQNGN